MNSREVRKGPEQIIETITAYIELLIASLLRVWKTIKLFMTTQNGFVTNKHWFLAQNSFTLQKFKAVKAADDNPKEHFMRNLKNHMKFLEFVEQHSLFHALPSYASPDNSQIQ